MLEDETLALIMDLHVEFLNDFPKNVSQCHADYNKQQIPVKKSSLAICIQKTAELTLNEQPNPFFNAESEVKRER